MIRKLAILCAAAALLVGALTSTGIARSHHGSAPTGPLGPGPVVPVAPAVRATNTLALQLLPRLGAGGNLVFSPYSIEAALAMVDQGAAGTTASQLQHVLGGSDASLLGGSNRALAGSLSASVTPPLRAAAKDAAQLLVANGLWAQQGLGLQAPFSSSLSDDFGAAPQAVDFTGDAAGAPGDQRLDRRPHRPRSESGRPSP